jgi:hypothetical protein
MPRFISIAILLCITTVVNSQTQDKRLPVQVDMFGTFSCDDLLARIAAFQIRLSENPGATGYVVINPEENSYKKALSIKQSIEEAWVWNKFDLNRLKFVRGEDLDRLTINFWLVIPGADEPQFISANWPDGLENTTAPYIYRTEFADVICPTFWPKPYVDFIKANPNLRAHVVINSRSALKRHQLARKWRQTLLKEYGISPTRFRVFLGNNTKLGNNVEFWIVPINKK